MTCHQIRFTKRVCDDSGHMHQATQAVVEVKHARDTDRAIRAAQHRFARLHRARQWDIYADTFEVRILRERTP